MISLYSVINSIYIIYIYIINSILAAPVTKTEVRYIGTAINLYFMLFYVRLHTLGD
jgi:hypothetical protein